MELLCVYNKCIPFESSHVVAMYPSFDENKQIPNNDLNPDAELLRIAY